jgi:hypothetical protein
MSECLDESLIPAADSRPRCEVCDCPKVCQEERIEYFYAHRRWWETATARIKWWLSGQPGDDPPAPCVASKQFYVCPDVSRLCPGYIDDLTAIETWRRKTDPTQTYSPFYVERDVERFVESRRNQQHSYARIRAAHSEDAADREPDPATGSARREVARQIHDYARDLKRRRYEDDCHPPAEAADE